ncbi:MAG TPA: RNA polymerase sigma factor [Vitreimonas sp.]|uniref:RNA polymerase sigma factor n=1 Tax=Vitreimonas sp. TaxID=3069702 RepID=UPI002D72E8D4|nr:RNA polymerase sigma factor [Vitreimonas sp.]HYD86055.1 RNA polymerase sigma factor [Vitreimonas sp.]
MQQPNIIRLDPARPQNAAAAQAARSGRGAAAQAQAEADLGNGFVRFFEREWPNLRAYLHRLGAAAEAEDLAQEAFARIYEARARVRSPAGALYRTARNLAVDRKRAESRWRASDTNVDGLEDPRPSPEDEVHWRLKLERTAHMLARMSPKCRRVFLLRVSEGCSYAEIADRCGMTHTAVEKQLLRAFETCAQWAEREGQTRTGLRRARSP